MTVATVLSAMCINIDNLTLEHNSIMSNQYRAVKVVFSDSSSIGGEARWTAVVSDKRKGNCFGRFGRHATTK